jgi:hypothetical protein
MDRDYNFRSFNQQRVVKKRILNTVYANHYYSSIRRRLLYPEDKWFNYLGEYTQPLKSGGTGFSYRSDYNDDWKEKYHRCRARFKMKTYKELNDTIGEKYHISY